MKNTGDYRTRQLFVDIHYDLRGIGKTNASIWGKGLELKPDEKGFFDNGWWPETRGFGHIFVNVTVGADNADIVWKEEEGFVIGPFVII